MRKLVLAVLVAGTLVGGPAMAAGPSGSKESNANKVTCNRTSGPAEGGGNVYAAGNGVYAGSKGLEICSDDDAAIDGRVIVTTGFVAADGDDSNPSQAQGWARVDSKGPTCGPDPNPTTDKDNDATYGPGEAC